MIRSLITPQTNNLNIAIPNEYIGKKVEVLVFIYDDPIEVPEAEPNIMAQFWGVISEKTAGEMQKHVAASRAEWE